MTVAKNIKSTLPRIEIAKEFMKSVADCPDKSVVSTLMGTLNTTKFDGTCTMREHVIKMESLAAKLKNMGIRVDDSFVVQFIINSLPFECDPFQMNYNTVKDK